jgi:hypothetical protein
MTRELMMHPCVGGLLELPQFRECMGLVPFRPEVIAQYIHAVLPRDWKGEQQSDQTCVEA